MWPLVMGHISPKIRPISNGSDMAYFGQNQGVKSSQALVVIDHGDGWRTYYSHLASTDRVGLTIVNQGQRIGHPSCETEPGGTTFGVHVHFAIWQENVGFVDIAGSALSGWVISETTHYNGTMTLDNLIRRAEEGRSDGTNDIPNNPYDDDFSSSTLDTKWYWIREDPTQWSLTDSPGYLRIVTQPKDIWRQNNSAPVLLQALRSFTTDAFDIRTRVVISPVANFHQGGLVVYGDDDNYVRFTYAYINGPTFEFAKEVNGSFQPIQIPAPPNVNGFHLQLVKHGRNFYGYYSQNGTDWFLIGQHLNVNIPASAIGLLAFNAEDVTLLEIPADFDYFQVLDHHQLYLPVVVR